MRRVHLLAPLLGFVLPVVLAACGEAHVADARTDAPLVRTVPAQMENAGSRSFTGTVAARVQSDLGFRVAGKVLERLVDVGQSVHRGQRLMRIDPIDLMLAERAQEEAVAAARALAIQTAEEEIRYRNLLGTGAISASAYDQASAAADAASAQLSAAEAQADVARNASNYAELIADGDGIVVATLAEPGQVVSAGQVVLRLAHAGPREALIQLPETLRPSVGSVAQASLFGLEGVTVPATLRQIAQSADPLTRTFEARYVLSGELSNAPLGTTVSVHVTAPRSQANLHVPLSALFDPGKGPGVWVVAGEPLQATWRPVAVQQIDDEGAFVTGEVLPGEPVVSLGAHLLREGMQVRLANTALRDADQVRQP